MTPHAEHPDFPLLAALPFLLLLLAIAILPLAAPRWWHRDRNRALLAGALTAPIAALLLFTDPWSLLHTSHEYVSFIVLLGALFTISGGVVLEGDLQATPHTNTAFLAVGAVLANFVGTTGASMLLLRPLLRTNRERRNVAHLPVFFILIVSNCGGMLTPLADPPLYLGYLRGVPFFWTLRLLPIWFIFNVYLLAVFWLLDRRAHGREPVAALSADRLQVEKLRIRGFPNLVLLGIVVGSALLPSPWREIVMIAAGIASWSTTPAVAHARNHFDFAPMREVAILFAGIFVTMVPALALLYRHAGELGLRADWQFFWLTGILSSVLDNAPTYLTFLTVAQGLEHAPPLIAGVGVPHSLLVAISVGAVAMGANTYIGNGPNFMVKSLVEHRGIPMPSFAGFFLRAFAILLPAYVLTTALYFI